MNTYIENLNWRYATKNLMLLKKLSKKDLEDLLEATSLSASSYGLQPYEILVIEDPELRNKLQRGGPGDSPQITEASHLIILGQTSQLLEKELVDDYLENVSETRGISYKRSAGVFRFL